MSSIVTVYIILLVLWIISFLSFLAWLIGYPIYKKSKGKKVFDGGFTYATGILFGAFAMNILNMFMRIVASNF